MSKGEKPKPAKWTQRVPSKDAKKRREQNLEALNQLAAEAEKQEAEEFKALGWDNPPPMTAVDEWVSYGRALGLNVDPLSLSEVKEAVFAKLKLAKVESQIRAPITPSDRIVAPGTDVADATTPRVDVPLDGGTIAMARQAWAFLYEKAALNTTVAGVISCPPVGNIDVKVDDGPAFSTPPTFTPQALHPNGPDESSNPPMVWWNNKPVAVEKPVLFRVIQQLWQQGLVEPRLGVKFETAKVWRKAGRRITNQTRPGRRWGGEQARPINELLYRIRVPFKVVADNVSGEMWWEPAQIRSAA